MMTIVDHPRHSPTRTRSPANVLPANVLQRQVVQQRVERLPDAVIDRIAAGEVVARASSALKELLENALDAGASQVTVSVADGGMRMLQVSDNGIGICQDDMKVLCERFTTSKLRVFEDLAGIATFGFRGEALASLSHVAHLTIASTRRGAEFGMVCQYRDGKPIHEPRPCAAGAGTVVSAEELFYNLPVRRQKALRSFSEEYGRIVEIVQHYAIHNPQVAFVVKKHGTTSIAFRTTSQGSVESLGHAGGGGRNFQQKCRRKVIESIYGAAFLGADKTKKLGLIELNVTNSKPSFSLCGLISSPDARPKTSTFILFVNDRLVDNPTFKRVVETAFTETTSQRRGGGGGGGAKYFAYLSLIVPPTSVDVNVHPTKKEVIFLHELDIAQRAALEIEALLKSRGSSSRQFQVRMSIVERGIRSRTGGQTSRASSRASSPASSPPAVLVGLYESPPVSEEKVLSQKDSSSESAATRLGAFDDLDNEEDAGETPTHRTPTRRSPEEEMSATPAAAEESRFGVAPQTAYRVTLFEPSSPRPAVARMWTPPTVERTLVPCSDAAPSQKVRVYSSQLPEQTPPEGPARPRTDPRQMSLRSLIEMTPRGVKENSRFSGPPRRDSEEAVAGSAVATLAGGPLAPPAATFRQFIVRGDAACDGLRVEPAVHPLESVASRDDTDDPRDLNAIARLRQRVEQNVSEEATLMIRESSFVGAVDERLCLIQHQSKLVAVDLPVLLEEALYQSVLGRLGHLPSVEFCPPMGLKGLLPGRLRAMLDDYFSIRFDESGTHLLEFPLCCGRYFPGVEGLSDFFAELWSEVEWKDEERCLEGLGRSLARFFARLPPAAIRQEARPSPMNDELFSFVFHPSVAHSRRFQVPARLLQDGSITVLTTLASLYRVFERC